MESSMAYLKVTSIVFDLDCDDDDMTDNDKEILQKELQDKYIGKVYEIDDYLDDEEREDVEEQIVDKISNESGWCILGVSFESDREYELQFYAIDEDGSVNSVTEGYFSTIKEALERIDNIGSKWVLYPNARICLDGDIVNDYPVGR
jgi:hypothetical protein